MATRKSPRNHLADDLTDLEDLCPVKSTPDTIFESLARNAFDFLERGIQEFDKAPKYSVIHFCAAVEMLLKARLMQEHWSLIVSKPEQAALAKFMAGDFISVTLDEARARLRDIADVDIPAEAFESFRRLATHRNKMIHFFHADMEDDNEARAKIVAEHCRSWLHLHQLLNRWEDYFKDFSGEIARAERSMKSHRKFLRVKFDALKKRLAALRKTGQKLQTCSACGFKAGVTDDLEEELLVVSCLVCDYTEVRVALDCPHCGKVVVLASEGHATCPHCNGAIEPSDVAAHLVDQDAMHVAAMDGDDSCNEANCSDCDGYHTVVRVGDKYFCTNCFVIFYSIQYCEWCNEGNTGDMDFSYSTGCNWCDGKVGWDKDD